MQAQREARLGKLFCPIRWTEASIPRGAAGVLAVAWSCCLLCAAPSRADDWGALAYSLSSEKAAVGVSEGEATRDDAEQAALEDCADSGGESCRVATVFANGGCGYITWGRGPEGTTGFAIGYGTSPEAAERNCRAQGAVACEAPAGGCTASATAPSGEPASASICSVTDNRPPGPATVHGEVTSEPEEVAFDLGRGRYSLELSDPKPTSYCQQPSLWVTAVDKPDCRLGQRAVARGTGIWEERYMFQEFQLINARIECR